MKRLLILLAVLAAIPAPLPAQQDADEGAVRAVIQRLFDGMRAADSAMVRSVFHPEARLMRAGTKDGRPTVGSTPVDAFVRAVGNATKEWDEQIHDVVIQVDGNLASAWTPYVFYHGGEFSHCGVNTFQLVRTEDGWKVLQLTDTSRREGCGVDASSGADAPRGSLFIVGGGSRPPELMRHFVELAGGPGKAKILVFPMASGSPEETGARHARELRELGAEARSVVLTRDDALRVDTEALLDGVTGVWFSGGSQSRITDALAGTPVHDALLAHYRRGAAIGGTSAGAAIMSDSMITGDQYLPGVDTLGYYGDEFPRIARRTIHITAGLGFLDNAVVDQHFLQRERHNRLVSVILERPEFIGVGIDESTAVIVRPDGTWEVVGESAAMVYDARRARITGAGAPVLGAAGVRMHLLPAGSRFDPATGRVELGRMQARK